MAKADEIDNRKRLLIGGVLATALVGPTAKATTVADPIFAKIEAWHRACDDIVPLRERVREIDSEIDRHFESRLANAVAHRKDFYRRWPGRPQQDSDIEFAYRTMNHYREVHRSEVKELADEMDRLDSQADELLIFAVLDVINQVPATHAGMIAMIDFLLDEHPYGVAWEDALESVLRSCREFAMTVEKICTPVTRASAAA